MNDFPLPLGRVLSSSSPSDLSIYRVSRDGLHLMAPEPTGSNNAKGMFPQKSVIIALGIHLL